MGKLISCRKCIARCWFVMIIRENVRLVWKMWKKGEGKEV